MSAAAFKLRKRRQKGAANANIEGTENIHVPA